MLTLDEAVRHMRSRPEYRDVVRDAYLGPDVDDSFRRFAGSAEWEEVKTLLGDAIEDAVVVDLGAGTGIASPAASRQACRSRSSRRTVSTFLSPAARRTSSTPVRCCTTHGIWMRRSQNARACFARVATSSPAASTWCGTTRSCRHFWPGTRCTSSRGARMPTRSRHTRVHSDAPVSRS